MTGHSVPGCAGSGWYVEYRVSILVEVRALVRLNLLRVDRRMGLMPQPRSIVSN